jgi:citrate lyase synthetase
MRVREQSQNVNRSASRVERYAKDAQYSIIAVKSIGKIEINANTITLHRFIDLLEY